MKFISHRGNLVGRYPQFENCPLRVDEVLDLGYDVEVDVWYTDGAYRLGHDEPQYRTSIDFLKRDGVWCHAKDVFTFERLLEVPDIHCFFHQNDDVTLTSCGYLWTYPGKQLTPKSICVLPETIGGEIAPCTGICSDIIAKYKHDHADRKGPEESKADHGE